MTGAEGINFVTVRVDSNKCDYCMECVNACTTGALTYDKAVKVFMHNAYECAFEEYCMDVCPNNAIEILDM